MNKSRTLTAALVTGVAVAVATAGCSSAPSNSAATTPGGNSPSTTAAASSMVNNGTMTILLASDPGNLDPLVTVNSATRQMDFFAYDPLVNLTSSGKLVSGLATAWFQQGNTYTFTLRRGVTCSDGSSFSAATAAANINFMANPKNKSALINLFVPAEARATAVGATTLKVTTVSAFPFFFQDMSQVGLACSAGLTKASTMANGTEGTGPYTLTSSVAGQSYTFSIHKGYDWGPSGATTAAEGLPAKVVFKVVSDATTQANLLLQGEANLATVQGLASKPLSAANLDSQSALVPLGELFMDQGNGRLLADPKLRLAVAAALDLNQIGEVLGQGLGAPATGLATVTPKACPGNTVTGAVPTYNQSQAESLLNADGWKASSGGVRSKDGKRLALKLIYTTDAGGDPASAFELAAQDLKKVGIDLQLQEETTTQLESVIFGTGSWDLVNIPLGINTPAEAVPFVSGTAAPNGENFAHINNATYNSLVARAEKASGATGCGNWDNAERALFEAADVLPFENAEEPVWAKDADFTVAAGLILPTSLRLLKH